MHTYADGISNVAADHATLGLHLPRSGAAAAAPPVAPAPDTEPKSMVHAPLLGRGGADSFMTAPGASKEAGQGAGKAAASDMPTGGNAPAEGVDAAGTAQAAPAAEAVPVEGRGEADAAGPAASASLFSIAGMSAKLAQLTGMQAASPKAPSPGADAALQAAAAEDSQGRAAGVPPQGATVLQPDSEAHAEEPGMPGEVSLVAVLLVHRSVGSLPRAPLLIANAIKRTEQVRQGLSCHGGRQTKEITKPPLPSPRVPPAVLPGKFHA